MLFRAALFCRQTLTPELLHETLRLTAPALRQPSRDLPRSACSLLARLATDAPACGLPLQKDPHLGAEVLAGLLAALASHAAQDLLPRVAECLRLLLLSCGDTAAGMLNAALAVEHAKATAAAAKATAAAATPPSAEKFSAAALETLDDARAFRAVACDFSLLARATAPPPREALQSSVFL
jgi:hypothetical protein